MTTNKSKDGKKTNGNPKLQSLVRVFEAGPERTFYCPDYEGGFHQGAYRECKVLNLKVVVEHEDGILEMDLGDLRLKNPNVQK